jgi:putative tRNA adenosine deaminase-associated protein
MAEETLVDFALVAYREDGQWQVGSLPPRVAVDLHAFVHALRQQQSDGIALGLCSYGDDFFLAVRLHGEDVRLLLSDVSAVGEWPIAQQALELIEEPEPEEEGVQPGGDLSIFADLGVSAMEVAAICSELELYPDEMLGQIATHIGFGPQFEQAVDPDKA